MTSFRAALLTTAALALASALPATAAHAAEAGGTTVLRLDGAAYDSLHAQGVGVAAVAPAVGRATTITLPVRTATVQTAAAVVTHGGGLRLRARRGGRTRTATLSALTLRIGARTTLSARLGDRTVTLFTVAAPASARRLDRTDGTATLRSATLRLSGAGASALRRALGLRQLAPGTVASVRSAAAPKRTGDAATGSGPTSGSAPGSGTGPSTDPGPTTGAGTGGPTGAPTASCAPTGGSGGPEAPAAPASARAVTGGTLTWHVRPSLIQYMAQGEGTSVAGGATAGPKTVQAPSATALVYDFSFPISGGWYEPLTGRLYVASTGTVCFRYRAHGIALRASDPELELTAARRVIARTANESAGTRGVLADLQSGAATDTRGPVGSGPFDVTRIPATVPAGAAQTVFAGQYLGGEPFGHFSVSFTVAG